MLSGNGRHRRPRQAPALIVAAGVTGSAIAIPLLGATSASAADGTTWDRVAECESGGAWSASDGNGYYGGLQLTQENWESYGGLKYAPSADQASRSQQIAVAEKLLDDQGLAAWPTCGPLSGLSKHSGSVEVDTGVANDSSSSSDSSDSSRSSHESGSSDSSDSRSDSSSDASSGETGNATKSDTSQGSHSSDTDKAESDESDKSGQNDSSSAASDSATSGAGRHRGGNADEDATEGATDGRTDGTSGRHASRGSDASRDAGDSSYVVRAGDSLWTIADSLDLKGGWAELYTENKHAVGTDPDLILPGQRLAVDAESGEK
ncbi:peptidoglycan-binding protein LysM [Streptomyces albiflavescens]|uniref:Peptidoglycan-binding protein LysM n=1 Tax=Streptomyces albiflavescens TaxID=1623582 RepID=A0A917YF64_9ACTN|nr:transglycosylase family protein [Streptomyces albiflavescens]GGN92950.1 peptidoglycan-binding protein LysM [Streptomyces albiflavescens]